MGKCDRIQFSETVSTAEVIAEFRILITEDAPVAELEMTGEK